MRSENCLEWSDDEWLDWRREAWERLDPEVRADAAKYLQSKLPADVIVNIRERILENRAHWIGGRMAECWWCEGKGSLVLPDEALPSECRVCQGSGRSKEPPLHHGWGTAIRNLLRDGGFGEALMGVGNLDDYYIPLVEAAAGLPPS